ncbi:RNA polymerase sigma factor [Rhizohabitans arisaemae]|uniref:RNA polymerase sigma factor n=1 Tax=Rhizohabitans arisaemae TaxID=2720610 RepID=UPI0024B21378|nr:sigma-70 family RNA polymerase sigma factor [Rhizohabitans arisaemae]
MTTEALNVHPEEAADLLKAADGDPGAWQRIVERFSGLVWSITRGHGLDNADAADVFQTTWLRLAEHLGRIEHPERLGAWLATTTRRECAKVLRAIRRVTPTADITFLEHNLRDDSAEDVVVEAEHQAATQDRERRLWEALREMPGRCGELIRVMLSSPQPSYAEIAETLSIPIGSIGPTRARCFDRLRRKLTP